MEIYMKETTHEAVSPVQIGRTQCKVMPSPSIFERSHQLRKRRVWPIEIAYPSSYCHISVFSFLQNFSWELFTVLCAPYLLNSLPPGKVTSDFTLSNPRATFLSSSFLTLGSIWHSWTLSFETLSYLGFCNTNSSDSFPTSEATPSQSPSPLDYLLEGREPQSHTLALFSFWVIPSSPKTLNPMPRLTTPNFYLWSWPLSWVLDSNIHLSTWYL